MQVKGDTVLPEFTPGCLFGLMVAKEVYREEGVDFVITSGKDSRHSETSLHYSGNAADLRTWYLPDPAATAKKIKERLNRHYDVIFEGDHIHLEYQPRG